MKKLFRNLTLFTLLFLAGFNTTAQNSKAMFFKNQGACDSDATDFIDATGISDNTIESAICQLVKDLKDYGIWSKMVAIYPFVGGTSDTHKYNLKDPRDLDAAFRLSYAGSLTHDSNGITGASSSYANTHMNAFNNLTLNDVHLSFYNNTTGSGETTCDIGAATSSGEMYMWTYRTDNTFKWDMHRSSVRMSASTGQNGFSIGSRTSSTLNKIYKDGTLLDTDTTTNDGVLPNQNIYILAANVNGSPNYFSTKRSAFATIGSGLTETEAGDLYTIVQAFQTTLSREV